MKAGTFAGNFGRLLPDIKVDQFFDRKHIEKQMTKAEVQYYRESGATTRRIGQRSMRRVKNSRLISNPGNPPYAKQGGLRDGIRFGWDMRRRSVAIGPVVWRGGYSKSGSTIPSILEHGGVLFNHRSGRDATYRPRPYMGPARDKVIPRLPGIYQRAFQKKAKGSTRKR